MRVYSLLVSTVLVGDSYVSVYEREAFESFIRDPLTRVVREGTLLVFAPDASQGFPSSAGADGVYFTADDPLVALPAGYTLATLGKDGAVSFSRPRLARMDALEAPADARVSFADQGTVQGFNSLIDYLKVHYAYTELRKLDWEAIRQRYLPRVEAAETADDVADYLIALTDLGYELRDFHVGVVAAGAPREVAVAANEKTGAPISTNVGAAVKTLSDGRVIVYFLDPNGPAAAAGWVFGTEIVGVQGQPASD